MMIAAIQEESFDLHLFRRRILEDLVAGVGSDQFKSTIENDRLYGHQSPRRFKIYLHCCFKFPYSEFLTFSNDEGQLVDEMRNRTQQLALTSRT